MPNLLTELILDEIGDERKEIHTGFPATIVRYENQFCRVKPNINFRYQDGDVIEPADIDGVPFCFAGGGGGILSFPVKVGDVVWIQCSMVALDEWLQQYQNSFTPSSRRMHSINDAVVTAVLFTKDLRVGVDPDHIELKFHKLPEGDSNKYSTETWSSLKLKNDGAVELITDNNQSVKLNQDKSIVIENGDVGNKVELLSNGKVEITTASTIKIQNGSEELVSLLSEVVTLLGNPSVTTTNTMIGNMPLNSFSQLQALASRIDTLKG